MLPALMAQEITDQLREQGVAVVPGGIPLGITKNARGENIMYYAGPDLLPAYLMEVDTLIGPTFLHEFKERKEGVEYFHSFGWDTTKAGFVDITRPDESVVRAWYTQHQPTEISILPVDDPKKRIWYRKIEATVRDGVIVAIWEKFER